MGNGERAYPACVFQRPEPVLYIGFHGKCREASFYLFGAVVKRDSNSAANYNRFMIDKVLPAVVGIAFFKKKGAEGHYCLPAALHNMQAGEWNILVFVDQLNARSLIHIVPTYLTP